MVCDKEGTFSSRWREEGMVYHVLLRPRGIEVELLCKVVIPRKRIKRPCFPSGESEKSNV